MRAPRPLCVVGSLLLLLASIPAWAADYHGQVFYQGVPVPGASVVMAQGSQHLSTVTDDQGFYNFPNIGNGSWKIKIAKQGFTTLNADVTVAPNAPQGHWELRMLTFSRLMALSRARKPRVQPKLLRRPGEEPSQESRNSAVPPNNETAEISSGGLLVNGTSNNAAASKYALSASFGNHRPKSRGLYTGSLGVTVGDSAFDARPYSLTGLTLPKDSYSRVTGVATFGGPIEIPHLFYNGPYLYVAYQWTRDSTAAADSGLVPTAAERNGDLSGLLNGAGQPLSIYDPATGRPFTGPIPVSPQAKALLALYPLPNLPGNGRYNYQTQVLNRTHIDALQSRLSKSLGHRDDLDGGFAFERSRVDNANFFGFRDATDVLGLDAHIHWSHQFNHHILGDFGFHFTRLRTRVRPQFAGVTNISGNAGITGNSQAPQDWGPPGLIFSSGIAGLADANSEFNRNRTDSVSFKGTWTHLRHTVNFGGDFRRLEFNQFTQLNPRGTFAFTGAATQAPAGAGAGPGTTGSDLADFLLGIPDTSNLNFGDPSKYFRSSVYDGYLNDKFRVLSNFTINAGLRWAYGSPMTELFGHLVNLDIAPGFTAAAPVLASDPRGPVTGTPYPASLVRPDYRGWEPRIGIAWRPFIASSTVVRAGYGIYDDTSVYLSSAERMAEQAPLATSISVANSSACPLTLALGFRNCAATTTNTYAMAPDFHVGYAQDWKLSVQTDLPGALVLSVTYLGIKGTHGAQEFLPNTYPPGETNPYPGRPVGFVYRTSGGNSTLESGEVQLLRRLRGGFTATVDYTWAKAMDDDVQLGGVGYVTTPAATGPLSAFSSTSSPSAMIAQNWLDLKAKRGRSSFDQRHLLKASFEYTPGMGLGGRRLLNGGLGRLLKNWTMTTDITVGSGMPENPIVLETVPGTGVSNIVRPDPTGAPIYGGAPGYYLNSAAFAAPLPGQWGTARRSSITGPAEFSLDNAVMRSFHVHRNWILNVRVEATNTLNHATWTAWNTTVSSPLFGLPVAVNPMRSLRIATRLKF
jgi:hypothetical protein